MNFAIGAAAFGAALLVGLDADAFSKIEPSEGSSESKEGILAVPLPPVPSADQGGSDQAAPAADDGTGRERTDDGDAPLSPAEDAANGIHETDAPPETARSSSDGGPAGATDTGSDLKAPSPDVTTDRNSPDHGAAPAPAVPLPIEIGYGDASLPATVRDLRTKLIAIAKAGDIEGLRPYIEPGVDGTVLSFGNVVGDPIEFLKQNSGDGEGIETLAILLELLQAGHVRVEPGTDNEIYVWPYFTQVAIDDLTRPQLVELFELVTAGDYAAMREFGAYNFYRVGISPEGRLGFFVAGD